MISELEESQVKALAPTLKTLKLAGNSISSGIGNLLLLMFMCNALNIPLLKFPIKRLKHFDYKHSYLTTSYHQVRVSTNKNRVFYVIMTS